MIKILPGKRFLIRTMVFAVLCMHIGTNMHARQSWRWIMLAQRRVNFSLGSDVFEFGSRQSRYHLLQLKLVNGTMNLYNLEIEYRDGSREEIPVTHTFRPGNDAVIIAVQDRVRIIKSVTLYYDTDNYSQNNATMMIFGSH